MVHEATVAGMTAGAFFGNFVFTMFEHVCGGMTHHKVDRVIEHAARRFAEGELPPNHNLEDAIYEALGQTTRLLAYHLHDPERGPMRELLSNLQVGNFLHRFAELAQNNIVAGTPRDHWLADLIQEAKDPKNFCDFPLKIVLDDYKISRLLTSQTDAGLREYFHQEFLAWVERHVPDNGHKPSDFADKVANGWIAGGEAGDKLAFYDVFGLFFREALKLKSEVFHAFSANVLTGLTQDMEEIKALLPSAATLKDFTETLHCFEEKEFDANYSRFKNWTRRQNEKLYQSMREGFEAVHKHLDMQDAELANIKSTAITHKEESRDSFRVLLRYGKWIAAALLLVLVALGFFWRQHYSLEAKLNAALKRDAPGSELLAEFRAELEAKSFSAQKFDPGLREAAAVGAVARKHGMTADELRQKMLQAAQGAIERKELVKSLRQASESETARLRQIERDANKDLAVAALADQDYAKALDYYQQALALTSSEIETREWAELQVSLGIGHWELGIRIEGASANQHLREAAVAYSISY